MMTARLLSMFLLILGAAPAAAETVAIVNARIVTMSPSGDIPSGTVVIAEGRISAIGAGVKPPAGARIIEGHGGIVTPGFIQADSTLGAVEVSQVPATSDRANHAATISAAFDISQGLNPNSILLPVIRLAGITSAVVTPLYDDRPGRQLLFAGQAAVVDLGQRPDMVIRPRVAMVLELGEGGAGRAGGARGATYALLREIFTDVRFYARNRALYERGSGRALSLSRLDLEALLPVADGRMKLIVKVDRASDIRDAITFARAEHLDIILDGAAEGWRVADEIAGARIPVMIDAFADLPHSFSELGSTLENAARLDRAGVTVVIKAGSGIAHRSRELRYAAGNAVAHGLPWHVALAGLTINPATIFEVQDRIGSLAPGKSADLVLWSGDPLEPLSQPQAIFIHGIEQPLTSRPLQLRDRYLGRAGSR